MKHAIAILIACASFALTANSGPNVARFAATRQQEASSGLWTDTNTYAFLLDEPHSTNTATPIDNSGNGLAVTNTGTVYLNLGTNATRGVAEGGRTWDGSDDSIDIAQSPSLCLGANRPITIGAWIKHAGIGGDDYPNYFGNYRSGAMSIWFLSDAPKGTFYPSVAICETNTTGRKIYLETSLGAVSAWSNVWVFLVATWDGTANTNALRLYTNGTLLSVGGSFGGGGFTSANTNAYLWSIGSAAGSSANSFPGSMDFVFCDLSNAWSAATIASVYTNTGGTNGPVGNIRARLPTAGYQ